MATTTTQMKKILFPFLFFTALSVNAKIFKVVGYVPDYRWNIISKLDYSQLTHICVAFINPDSTGTLSFSQNIDALVTLAHAQGVSVLPSLAGGGSYSWGEDVSIYENLLDDANRTPFIHKIMDYVRLHHLDGVDLDLEGNALKLANYNKFACELADSLHAGNLEISGAFATGYYAQFVDAATLEKMDFIGTMSYGGVGSWNYDQPMDEATFDKFVDDVEYFKGTGMNYDAVAGGIPFYAVEFPMSAQSTYWQYNYDVCSAFTGSKFTGQDPLHHDTLLTVSNHPVYLNSLPTLKKKIEYAVKNAGGIMIWELGCDCYVGQLNIMDSLSTYINAALAVQNTNSPSLVKVFPNPASNTLNLSGEYQNVNNYFIVDMLGRAVYSGISPSSSINISAIDPGIYSLVFIHPDNLHSVVRLVVE